MVFNTCSLYAEDIFPSSETIEMPTGPFEYEVTNRFEPDPNDFDADGLKNSDEEKYGTDPNDPDTDNNGLTDLWQIEHGTDSNKVDTSRYLQVIDLEKGPDPIKATDTTNDKLNVDPILNPFENPDEITPDTSVDDNEIVPPIPGSENDLPPFPWDDETYLPKLTEEAESINTDEYTEIIPPIFENEEDISLSKDNADESISIESLNDLVDEEINQDAMLNRTTSGPDLTPIYMLLLLNDNDGDGMDDDWELAHFGTLAYGADEDPDQDNLSNLGEYNNHTDPNNPDSDLDGLTDGFEVLNGLNPNDIDTDHDGLEDAYEITNSLDPKDPDMDDDGLLDGAEITAGTDPNDSDTDDDGMPDLWEVTSGTNPLVNDRNVDLDSDIYSNLMEYVFHSDPSDSNDVPENASKGSYYEYDALGRIKSIIRAK